jgi:hypothetical protein
VKFFQNNFLGWSWLLCGVVAGVLFTATPAQATELCRNGEVIKRGTRIVGCRFGTWGANEQSQCNGAQVFLPKPEGSCYVCVLAEEAPVVESPSRWAELTISGAPANFSCLGGYCARLPAEPRAWYPLNEAAGPTAADSIGLTNGLHVNGPTPVAGRVGNALRFDGLNDYVEAPSTAANQLGTGDLSIDAWVRTSRTSGIQMIVDKREESSTVQGYGFYLYNGGMLGFQLADGTGFTSYGANNVSIADGRWHLVAVTVDRDDPWGGGFWIDGVLVATFNPTVRPGSLDNSRPLRIGSRSSSVSGIFAGDIDEVAVYNRVLTSEELSGLYVAGSAGRCSPQCTQPPPSMSAWYPLDAWTGTTAWERIAFNHGVHVNGPVPVLGRVGPALRFDGVNDYVEAPSNPFNQLGTGDLSIDAWVRTSRTSGIQMIVDKREESSTVQGYGFYLYNGGMLGFQLADGTGFTSYGANNVSIADGRWHLVAVTVDRDDPWGGGFWIDGVLVATFNPTVRPGSLDNSRPLRIGSRSSSVSGIFTGDIDEVEVFNRVLTAGEISRLYQAGLAGKCK